MCDVFLFADETILVVSESAIFRSDGCAGTDTLGNDAVFETTLGSSTGWGATTVDYGVNYDGNVG